jgi:cullin-associated NEDD8-dissociated protein 1
VGTAELTGLLRRFLNLLNDPDLGVRRQCLLSINALAHANLLLLEALFPTVILPALFAATKPDPSHVRTVDFGPFKHKIDDGLPLRKAAYQCLDTLLDVAPAALLDLPTFVRHVANGVKDQDDLQVVAYNVLEKVAHWHGPALLEVRLPHFK